MSRHSVTPFQYHIPVFVKTPLQARGRIWEVGTQFKWAEMGMDPKRIAIMYKQGFLYHDDDLAAAADTTQIGDGLADLDLESLHAIAKGINDKVKAKAKTPAELQKAKCKVSQIKDKQIGIIRTWRRNYGPKYE